MKKMSLFMIALTIAVFFTYSCSDDSTNTPDPTPKGNKYFPKTEGSWWMYSNYKLTASGEKDAETEYFSKLILKANEMKDEKDASVFQVQDTSGNKIGDNQFYYSTNTQIWNYSDLLPDLEISIPFEVPEAWYKFADENATSWTLYSQYLDHVEYEFGTYKITFDDTAKFVATYNGTSDIKYGYNLEKTVTAKKYTVSLIFGGKTTTPGLSIPVKVDVNYYWAANIGLVMQEMLPYEIKVITQTLFKDLGWQKILLNYEIKK